MLVYLYGEDGKNVRGKRSSEVKKERIEVKESMGNREGKDCGKMGKRA